MHKKQTDKKTHENMNVPPVAELARTLRRRNLEARHAAENLVKQQAFEAEMRKVHSEAALENLNLIPAKAPAANEESNLFR